MSLMMILPDKVYSWLQNKGYDIPKILCEEKDFNKSVSDDFNVENEIVFCRNIFTKK